MTSAFVRHRRLWPSGPVGSVKWLLLEPVLLSARHYLGNPSRNGYLRRFMLVSLLERVQAREQAAMFPAAATAAGYAFHGPREMVEARFEPAVTRLVERLAPRHDLFVDVGAHVGYYTCLARHLGCAVTAVEPDPVNVHHLMRNLEDNGWTDVGVHPVAVGAATGVAHLHGGGLCSSLVPGWADASARVRHRVPMRPLVDVVPGGEGSMLVKLDVEGYELAVLRGAEALLARDPAPCWIVENCPGEPYPAGRNDDFTALFELFFSHGYRAWVVDGYRRTHLAPVDADTLTRWRTHPPRDEDGYNFLFVRDGACAAALADLCAPS
jgi:FkbM family methyltransferase